MRIQVYDTEAKAVARVVDMICETVRHQPDAALGLATGGTMETVYDGLIGRYRAGEVSFARAASFNLDEYIGLGADHPQSYHRYMAARLFGQVDFAPDATCLPRGDAADPDEAAAEYEAQIAARGPIALQLLGIGRNGHIGFNEPSSSLVSRTREKTLARDTIEANSRYFAPGEKVPIQALTMGIGTILDAKRIVLLATGKGKAHAVAAMSEGPVTAMCPASALQMHDDVTVVLDQEAAALLRMRDYYAWVQQVDASE